MKNLVLFCVILTQILFLTCCNEDENIDESNKNEMLSDKITRENIITIDKFMLPNEIYVYRVMLDLSLIHI